MTDSLRDRIAAAIYSTPPVWDQWPWDDLTDDARQQYREQADAVIAALALGIPCAATGCRMKQIARRHAETSSGLEQPQ